MVKVKKSFLYVHVQKILIFFEQILFVEKGYSLKDNLMTNSVIVVTIYVIKVSHGALCGDAGVEKTIGP